MSFGCDKPVHWKANKDGWFAEAYMQLCPYSVDLDDYVYDYQVGAPIMSSMYGNSIDSAYTSWGFSDARVPHPPPGWWWVVPWECPVCPTGGCMSPYGIKDPHPT